jgi:TPR repeat protein
VQENRPQPTVILHMLKMAPLIAITISLFFLALPTLAQPPSLGRDVKLQLKKAKAGDAESQHKVAGAYWNGRGAPRDKEIALKWYRKAVAQEYWPAQMELAKRLSEPTKRQNRKEAFLLYQAVAEKGLPPGQHELAKAYLKGRGTEADPQKALELLDDLVRKEYAPSMVFMAELYRDGEHVESDGEKYADLIRRAAETDHPESRFRYYVFLRQGGERELAMVELKKAAALGYLPASAELNSIASERLRNKPKKRRTTKKKTPPIRMDKLNPGEQRIMNVFTGVFLAFIALVLFVKREELAKYMPSTGVNLPGVVKGPDFQLDVRVFKWGDGLTGIFYRGRTRVALYPKGDLTRQFFFRCILGEYSRAHSRPNLEKLQRIAGGKAKGHPIRLVSVGKKFRAEFSFDTGPSLEQFHIIYNPNSRQLQASCEIVATAWDGDDYRPSNKSKEKALSKDAFLATCKDLRTVRDRVLELIDKRESNEAHQSCDVLVEDLQRLTPSPEFQSYHSAFLSLSHELCYWAITGDKRNTIDPLLEKVSAMERRLFS